MSRSNVISVLVAVVSAVLLIPATALAASGAGPRPVLVGNAVASDADVVATVDVNSAASAHCTAGVLRSFEGGSRGAANRSGRRRGVELARSDRSAAWGVAGVGRVRREWKAERRCGQAAHDWSPPRSQSGARDQTQPSGSRDPHIRGEGRRPWSRWRQPISPRRMHVVCVARRPDLPWFAGASGNALNWGRSAQAHGIPTGSDAALGAIVGFQPGQFGAYGAGHVAYVESVNGDNMTISEWNYGARYHHKRSPLRTIRWRNARLTFIYGGQAGPPSTPPTGQQAGAYPHRVYHTCANGACGLRLHSQPSLSAPVTGTRNDGDEVDIICQALGDRVSGIDGLSSPVWDRLPDGSYASDFYVATPGSNGAFSPPIPRCDSSPPPPAPPPPSSTAVTHYNCGGTPNAFGHYVPAGKHWGDSFVAQGSRITGGLLQIGANPDGGNHQARIGPYTGGPYTLSGELGAVIVNVSGYGGVNFTFPQPVAVSPGQGLWVAATGIGDFTAYDQNNGGVDGCFIGRLDG